MEFLTIILLNYGGRIYMNVNNLTQDNKTYELIKKSLDASALRSKVISNNISNVNTKGYKKYYVSFEDTLKDEVGALELKTTDDRHIKNQSEKGEISIKQDLSSSMREDGNNIDIENEMANQAANTLLYNAMITQMNNRLTNTRNVITGGGR
jgi:flagellar basal-body rod protein FlgB